MLILAYLNWKRAIKTSFENNLDNEHRLTKVYLNY